MKIEYVLLDHMIYRFREYEGWISVTWS